VVDPEAKTVEKSEYPTLVVASVTAVAAAASKRNSVAKHRPRDFSTRATSATWSSMPSANMCVKTEAAITRSNVSSW
jgi:hypothetical protein